MGQNGGHRAFSQLWLRKKKCAGTDRKYENDNKMEEISGFLVMTVVCSFVLTFGLSIYCVILISCS